LSRRGKRQPCVHGRGGGTGYTLVRPGIGIVVSKMRRKGGSVRKRHLRTRGKRRYILERTWEAGCKHPKKKNQPVAYEKNQGGKDVCEDGV